MITDTTELDPSTARIRALNDELRTTGFGGETYLTRGVNQLQPETLKRALEAVRTFKDWSDDNDPWHQHDCAFIQVEPGVRVMFKIDYYDVDKVWGSPDPADDRVTVRVLTILLPEEY